MRILVTGAAGNLGSKLLEDLTQAGHDVLGTDVIGDHVARLDICDFSATRAFLREHTGHSLLCTLPPGPMWMAVPVIRNARCW